MQYYQHRFETTECYLHHRPPYLLVDRIVSIEPKEIVTEKTVTGEEFFIRGHFPQFSWGNDVVLNDQVSGVFDFSATISVDGQTIMRNGFQLMNIRSQMLQGG